MTKYLSTFRCLSLIIGHVALCLLLKDNDSNPMFYFVCDHYE